MVGTRNPLQARRGLDPIRQVAVKLAHRGVELSAPLRMDLVVDGCVVVEVKAVAELHGVHHAQLLTYLRLSGIRVGLLINFNAPQLRDGMRRVIA